MALIEHVWPWRQQPQEVALLSQSLGHGSWAYTPANGIVTETEVRLPAYHNGNNFYLVPVASGRGITGVYNYGAVLVPWQMPQFLPGMCYVAQFMLGTTSTTRVLGCGVNNGTHVETIGLNEAAGGAYAAGKFRVNLRDDAGRVVDAGSTAAVLSTNKLHTLVVYVASGASGGMRAWLDGAQIPLTWATTGWIGSAALQPNLFAIGNFNYGPSNNVTLNDGYTSNTYTLVARLGCQPLDGAALSANPWQLFEPIRIRIPGYSAAAGVPDITALYAESPLSDRVSYRATLNYA